MEHPLPHDIIDGANADPAHVVFVLHGILGSRRNWRSFTRRLAKQYPDWRYITVDLRGHGDAHGLPGPHTVDACAGDLARLATALDVQPRAVIGHSFGGKVALRYAALTPDGLEAVWSLDSPPGRWHRGAGGDEIARVFAAIRSLPMPAENRVAVSEHFVAEGFGRGIAGWMTTNVRRTDTGVVWRFDLPVLEALLSDYATLDVWDVLEQPPSGVTPHVLVAGRGQRWSTVAQGRLTRAFATRTHTLANSGHWVHVDDPEGLMVALGATLDGGP